MDIEKEKSIIQAILFAAGREVNITEIMSVLELGREEANIVMQSLITDFQSNSNGMEIVRLNDSYQMCSKKQYAEYIYPILDKRNKPNLSNAALETLAIIAYNPKITRAEIENIRGVGSDGTVYKLLEYGLIEEAGRLDVPGRPTIYQTTNDFLRKFGYSSLEELPDLPRYKVDENEQIVIDDLVENDKKEELDQETEIHYEAPMPEREELEKKTKRKKEKGAD